MKKLILSLIAFTALTLSAQNKIQWSAVREQNSNKRPIANAQVIFTDAPPASSDQNGKLRLAFKDKKPGAYVFLNSVEKAGYELVNNKEIEQVKISEGEQFGVDIILAKAGLVEASKKQYYGISDQALKAGFEREKAKIRVDLQAARMTAEQFEKKNEQLQTDYEHQQRELDVLAEKFARVNFDDVSPVYKEALESFKAGKIDDAIAKLETMNPAKRTQSIIKEQNRITKAQSELDNQKVALEKEKRQQIANLRLLADMYSLKFDPVKAEAQYDDLLRLDSTDLEILINAAEFYQLNHSYDKSFRINTTLVAHPKAEAWQVANANSHLGQLYTATGNLPAALKVFDKCYESYKLLAQQDKTSILYKNNLAVSYGKLGETYSALGNLQKALAFFELKVELSKELYAAFPQNAYFKNALAISYEKLGETHNALGSSQKALTFFEQYNNLEKELYAAFPQNAYFKNDLAISFQFLGNMHSLLGNLEKALAFFEQYSFLEKELYAAFPQNVDFKNGLAISYEKLGITYSSLGNLEKALTFFEDETKLLKELYTAFPQNVNFKNYLAISYSKLGDTHRSLGNLEKALPFFVQYNALEKELYAAFPQNVSFKNHLAISHQYLGIVYSSLSNLEKALPFFVQYNALEKELYTAFPQNVDFKNHLAISYQHLGDAYSSLGNLDKALPFFEQFSSLEKELYLTFPQNVSLKNGLAISYERMGATHSSLGNLEKALPFFEDATTLFKELYATYPQNVEFKNGLAVSYSKLGDIYFSMGKLDKALIFFELFIDLYAEICDALRYKASINPQHKPVLADALNNLAWYCFFAKKFSEAEKVIREALALNTGNEFLYSNLAPALLLQGKRDLALQEYKRWKDQAIRGQTTFKEVFLDDLKTFEKAGIIPLERKADVATVRKLLKEPKKK